jgi:hypothetical protein
MRTVCSGRCRGVIGLALATLALASCRAAPPSAAEIAGCYQPVLGFWEAEKSLHGVPACDEVRVQAPLQCRDGDSDWTGHRPTGALVAQDGAHAAQQFDRDHVIPHARGSALYLARCAPESVGAPCDGRHAGRGKG